MTEKRLTARPLTQISGNQVCSKTETVFYSFSFSFLSFLSFLHASQQLMSDGQTFSERL
jgi:hypothetical protein